MHSLRTALIAVVTALTTLGCEEQTEWKTASLTTAKACELLARTEVLPEDECQELCGDDDTEACSVAFRPGFFESTCVSPAAKTDLTVLSNVLQCKTTSHELVNPFESKDVDGRRPEGFIPTQRRARDLGAFFATCHELEAASIDAFERLGRELTAFGAPASLVDRARAAKRDEIKHARWTAALTREHGGEVAEVVASPLAVRDVFAMALENAVEGVVRETFGAARALYRATCFPDARTRRVMKRIADDELRHAELSWDVATFAFELLTSSERRAVTRAIDEELTRLERAPEDDVALRQRAGLPDQHACLRIIGTVRELLAHAPFRAAA